MTEQITADDAWMNAGFMNVPELASAVRAVLDLADWHETKAEKARRFPGVGHEAVMAKAAEVHDDAARRIRIAIATALSASEAGK